MERGQHQNTGKSIRLTSSEQICFSNRMISIRVFTNDFFDNLDLEQHGDDFLVCGISSDLELLAEEFKKHFLVKKAEMMSSIQSSSRETHFLKRQICVDEFGWHIELDKRYVKSLLDAMAMINANRWPLLFRRCRRARVRLRSWTQRNIESSDLVQESVSV